MRSQHWQPGRGVRKCEGRVADKVVESPRGDCVLDMEGLERMENGEDDISMLK